MDSNTNNDVEMRLLKAQNERCINLLCYIKEMLTGQVRVDFGALNEEIDKVLEDNDRT